MSESNAPDQLPLTDDTTSKKLRLLEDIGSAVIDVVHCFLKNARRLPFPLGKSVGYVEDTFSPWLDPLIASAEDGGLHLLSLADRKINAARDAAVKHIPLAPIFITSIDIVLSGEAPSKALSGLEKLRRRGVVGCTADVWVNYEPFVRSKSQGIYKLVNKVPGLSLAVYILHDIGSPLVSAVSEWIINHSEKKDKHQDLFTDSSSETSPHESSTQGPGDLKTSKDDSESTEHAEDHATEPQAYAKEQPTDTQEQAKEHVTESQIISSTPDKSVDSTEVVEGNTSEISVLPINGQNQGTVLSDHGKGEVLHITPPQEENEEHDEILDLFDTWGLGVQAISPKGLDSLRTLSLQNRSDRATHAKRKSMSFRL